MLTSEQVRQIKAQLLKQIETFPAEQREAAKQQVQAMSAEQLEQFLIQNKLIKTAPESQVTQQSQPQKDQQCIFCLITQGKIKSHKIDENKKAIGVLEINPISKGHTIIIPKEHAQEEKLPTQAFTLAKKIAKKLKSKLKPEKVEIAASSFMGHGIINLIPVYKDQKPGGERKKASEKELQEIQEKLATKKRKAPVIRKKKAKKKALKELPKAPVRFP